MPRLDISESQIEDALCGNLDLVAEYLGADKEVNLIARQLPLQGGKHRLDMLLSCGKKIFLVELKATMFLESHLRQILDYREDLRGLQKSGDLLEGEIESFLFVVQATERNIKAAATAGVRVVIYDPEKIMNAYFTRMASLSPFLQVKPKDHGTYSIRRMLRPLSQLSAGATKMDTIARKTSLRLPTVRHLLEGGKDFGLVRSKNQNFFLTDMGEEFVGAGGEESADSLSARQIEILKSFVAQNPFYSPSIFGVYAAIECAFLLARNAYPVKISELNSNFRMIGGKNSEWADNVLARRTRAFLRFSIELELLGRIGDKIVITPAGFRFILMLQLRKGIAMVEGLSLADDLQSRKNTQQRRQQ